MGRPRTPIGTFVDITNVKASGARDSGYDGPQTMKDRERDGVHRRDRLGFPDAGAVSRAVGLSAR